MNAALQIYENFRSAVVVHSGLRKEYEGSERAPLTRAPTFEKLQRLRGDQPSSDLSVGGDQRGFQAGPKARATSSLRNTGYTRGIYSVLVKETRVPLERLDAKLLLLLKSSVSPDASSARRSGVMKASKPVDRSLERK